MRLYHGSNQLITQIDLSRSKDFKDFGKGFYLTKDYSRAVAMAQRTTAIEGKGNPEISPFIFNIDRCPTNIRIRRICKVPWMGYLKNLEYPVHEKPKFSTFALS